MFQIDKITDKFILITDDNHTPIEIPICQFQNLFRVGFCITIHSAQGSTFNSDYCIYDYDLLDNRLLYVALSRATAKNLIHVA